MDLLVEKGSKNQGYVTNTNIKSRQTWSHGYHDMMILITEDV